MIKNFISFFKFECKQLLTFRVAIIPLILLVFTLGFVQNGLSDLKGTIEKKELFQEFEKRKVEQFFNYRVYGLRGFRLLFLPAPISIFFTNSVTIPDMNAFADSSEQLNIYKPLNTRTVFDLRKNWFTDYSGILLLIGSLLSLFYCFQSLNGVEYLKFLSTITSRKKIFWNIFLARGLLLFLLLLVFMACSLLLAAFNGFIVPIDKYVVSFLLICFLLLLMTCSIGFFCGTMKPKPSAWVFALLIWAVFIFFIPTLPEIVTANNSRTMFPIYQFEMEKLITFMNWEKMMLEKEGIVKLGEKPSESFKNRMLEFKQNELKKLQKMEEEQIAQLESNKRVYQLISSFFPTTFYQSANNEISSRGFNNLVDFCKFALEQKLQFIGLIIEKEYFSNYSKVEQFNAGNDNIYKAQPKLPDFFLLGILFNLLWIAAFAIPAYYRFKKNLVELPEKFKDEPTATNIEIESASMNSFQVADGTMARQFYNFFSNETGEFQKKGYSFNVKLDKQKLDAAPEKEFLYLCHPTDIPGYVKVGHFITLSMDLMNVNNTKRADIISRFNLASTWKKPVNSLDKDQLGMVFLSLLEMKTYPVYVFGNSGWKMKLAFCHSLLEKMRSLNKAGSIIIYISEGMEIICGSNEKTIKFIKNDLWFDHVDSCMKTTW